jgi:DNA-binding SARP family transcriptional activator
MLRVRVFGGLSVESGGTALDPPASRRARELLGWLALHPGRHARAAVAARFWPDVLDTSARASLRTTLHELRRALGPAGDCLVADRDAVALDAAWVDAREVEALLAAGRAEEALALRGGELLAGLEEEWVLAERDAFRERVAARLGALADAADAAGDRAAAVRLSREQVALDPLSEERGRALVRRLAAAGDRAAALAAYERLRERLRTGLRIAPSAETRALAEEIRASDAAGAVAPAAPAAPEDPAGLGAGPEVPSIVRRAGGAFVGRDAPLARLAAALDRARAGERRLVLIGGEPGIGKTRLMAEVCARAHAAGATVRFGRCFEEAIAPYQPFVEALGDTWLRDAAGAAEDAAGARWRLFESVDAALRTGAPTVLALDDLHWADKGSLLLVAHLVRATRPAALLVLGTYRESELSRTHPLAAALADLRREGLYERIPLTGLGPADVAALVRGWLGTDELAPALHEETAGNPFFLEEVVLHLREAGAAAGIPESVREVLGRRLSRLSDGANRALQAAAVAGRDFDVGLLERLDALAGVDALDAVEEAAAAQLVREDGTRPGRYGFAHPLVRETVYEELSLTRRVRLHGAVADALEALHGDDPAWLADLAGHRLAAAAGGDPAAAVEVALRAGRQSMARSAYEDAAAIATVALETLDGASGPLRADVLLLRGEARLRCADAAAARADFTAAAAIARDAGDPDRLARAALGASGLGVTIIAVDEEVVALLREALAALPDDGPLRARLLARTAIETYYASTPPERKALGDEAVAVAQRSLDPAALVSALNGRRVALWSAAFLRERLETATEMVAAAERAGDDEAVLQGRNWRVADLLEAGDVASALEEIERHEHLADRLRLPAYQWWGPMWRSTLAIAAGRIDEAERLIAGFEAMGARTGDRNAALYAEVQRYVLAVMGFGEPPLVDSLDRERDRPADYAYRAGYAWWLARLGQIDGSRELVAWLAADDWARLADDMNRLAALCEVSQAIVILGEPAWAGGAYERLAPYADRNVVNARGAGGYGSAELHLGQLAALLGRRAAAQAHLEAAVERNAATGADAWAAAARSALESLAA